MITRVHYCSFCRDTVFVRSNICSISSQLLFWWLLLRSLLDLHLFTQFCRLLDCLAIEEYRAVLWLFSYGIHAVRGGL